MMECKFLEHGLAIGYNQIVKPCCAWTADENYNKSFPSSPQLKSLWETQ